MNKRNSNYLALMGFVSANVNFIFSESDIMWLGTFIMFTGAFICAAIEEMR